MVVHEDEGRAHRPHGDGPSRKRGEPPTAAPHDDGGEHEERRGEQDRPAVADSSGPHEDGPADEDPGHRSLHGGDATRPANLTDQSSLFPGGSMPDVSLDEFTEEVTAFFNANAK